MNIQSCLFFHRNFKKKMKNEIKFRAFKIISKQDLKIGLDLNFKFPF